MSRYTLPQPMLQAVTKSIHLALLAVKMITLLHVATSQDNEKMDLTLDSITC